MAGRHCVGGTCRVAALAPGDRAVLDSFLAGIAATVGLRQSVSDEEAAEEFKGARLRATR